MWTTKTDVAIASPAVTQHKHPIYLRNIFIPTSSVYSMATLRTISDTHADYFHLGKHDAFDDSDGASQVKSDTVQLKTDRQHSVILHAPVCR